MTRNVPSRGSQSIPRLAAGIILLCGAAQVLHAAATGEDPVAREPGNTEGERLSAMDCGAKGDGTTDDTSALRKLFASGADHLVIDKDHTFLISGPLQMTNSNTTVEWQGRIRAADGVKYNQIVFGVPPIFRDGVPTLTLSNLTIHGDGQGEYDGNSLNAEEYFPTGTKAVYGGHGILVQGYNGVTIENLKVHDVVNYAIAVASSQHVRVTKCEVDSSRGTHSARYNGKNADGIHLTDVRHAEISHNHVISTDDNIGVTCLHGYSSDVAIVHNDLEHKILTTGHFIPLGYNIRLTTDMATNWWVENIVIATNILRGGNGALTALNLGTATNQTRQVKFVHNIIRDKIEPGIEGHIASVAVILNNVADFAIAHNEFSQLARIVISAQNAQDLAIVNNTFREIRPNPLMKVQPLILLDGHHATAGGGNIVIKDNNFDRDPKTAIRINPGREARQSYQNVRATENRSSISKPAEK